MGTKRSQVQINYFRSNGEPFDWKMRLLEVEYKTKSYSRNIRPNKDMVMYYIDNKWLDYQFEEESLLLIFEKFNDTNNPYHLFSRLLALNAIYSTAEHRNTLNIIKEWNKSIEQLEISDIMKKQWERYQKDNFYAKDIKYEDMIESLKEIGKML